MAFTEANLAYNQRIMVLLKVASEYEYKCYI